MLRELRVEPGNADAQPLRPGLGRQAEPAVENDVAEFAFGLQLAIFA